MTNRTVRAALLTIATAVTLPGASHVASALAGIVAAEVAFAEDPPPADPLRAAMEKAYLAAEKDHARVSFALAGGDDDAAKRNAFATDAFVGALAEKVRGAAAASEAPDPGALAQSLAQGAPLSATSLRVVLARMLPADRKLWPADDAAAVRAAFLRAVGQVFDATRFEDCWDRHFGDLPEVAAWRAAHAPKPEPPPPPPVDKPPATPPDKPPNAPPNVPPNEGPGPAPHDPPTGPTPPSPEPRNPPTPAVPALPAPDDPNPAANLVPLDRAHGWVGPWTGYIQEIAEKENRRQKRPAKNVWIDRYEVTCGEYLRFLRGLDPSKRRGMLPVGWPIGDDLEPQVPPGRERTPVTHVTYAQAAAYAASVGKRLPTEDEWDRAASGGEKEGRVFPWGDAPEGKTWAYKPANLDGPAAVDAYPDDRTAEGVVGLAGNVAEIVATLSDRRDVPAKLTSAVQVVIRGGYYRSPRSSECATTWRWFLGAEDSAQHVGFRCVMDESEYRKRIR